MMTLVELPGRAIVKSVSKVIDHEDVKVWEIETESKYHEPVITSAALYVSPRGLGTSRVALTLETTNETKDIKPSALSDTMFYVEYPDSDTWTAVASGGKHLYRLVIYRRSDDSEG